MKNFIMSLIILSWISNSLHSQILENGGKIPQQYQIDWTNAGQLPYSRSSGLTPVTPQIADNYYVIRRNIDPDTEIQNAINYAANQSGTTIIYFPGGVYYIDSPINLHVDNGHSNIVFQGAGAKSTILEFMVGKNNECIEISGKQNATSYTVDNNIQKSSATLNSTSAVNINVNDWIIYEEENFPHDPDESQRIGQITQIIGKSGNQYTLKDASSKDYTTSYNLTIRKITPITNVGFENLTIKRYETEPSNTGYNGGENLIFSYSVNCWLKGVHMSNTCRHHVCIYNSAHIEVSGCYIHDSNSWGEDSQGYGVNLGHASTNCLIENNIFHTLRHAMAASCGANSSVFVYNYSFDQRQMKLGVLFYNNLGDIDLHGRNSFANLYEHNDVVFIHADPYHEDGQGPYNTFIRNQARGEATLITAPSSAIDLDDAPSSAVLGCVMPNENDISSSGSTTFSVEYYGLHIPNNTWYSHYIANMFYNLSDFKLNDVSYFYSSTPDFINNHKFPSIGPKADGFDTPTNIIPAKTRYTSGNFTYNLNPTELPPNFEYHTTTFDATISKQADDVWIFFAPDGPLSSLAPGMYNCDRYEVEANITFPTQYTETPVAWLNQIGYSASSKPNSAVMYQSENTSLTSSTVKTWFYYVQNDVAGAINAWAPFDPFDEEVKCCVMGKPDHSGITLSGTLTSNETWSGAPVITGSVIVPENVTLTILPGTTVRFNGFFNLVVKKGGKIIAEGTQENPITFTSNTGTSRRSWKTIFVYGDNNSFKYCIFKYGDVALKLDANDPNDPGYRAIYNVVQNCKFFENDQALRIHENSLQVCNCDILNNRHALVLCNNTVIYFWGNHIRDNERDGIYSWSNNVYTLCQSNLIENNGTGSSSSRCGIYSRFDTYFDIGLDVINGHNTIRNNHSHEVYAYKNDWVDIDGASIHDDTGYEIYSYNTPVNTWCNWFGEYPPNTNQIYGDVQINDAEQQEPSWEGITVGSGLNKTINSNLKNEDKKEKVDKLKDKLSVELPVDTTKILLKELYVLIHTDYNDDELNEKNTFADILLTNHDKQKNNANKYIYKKYMIKWAMLEGKYADAIDLSKDNLKKNNGEDNEYFLSNLVYLCLKLGDLKEAEKYLKEYKKDYPNESEIIELLDKQLEDVTWEVNSGLKKSFSKDNGNAFANQVIKEFTLLPNYPNPFNPTTNITYHIPEQSHVSLSIYDVLGRKIKQLVSEEQNRGVYTLTWDGTNAQNQPMPSGVYICKINADTKIKQNVATLKLMLMK